MWNPSWNTPEVIDLTTSFSSSSSSSSSKDTNPSLFYFPLQEPRPKKSPFLPSSEDDSVVDPSESSRGSDDSTERLEPIFNRLVQEESEKAKPSPSHPQPRLRAKNPPLPKNREVVLGLSASVFGDSSHIVKGKGKRKME